ncbi:MAG: hypothetical protein K0V04_35070, partial [Deltaproteobacteria bacterium]|nr:hypothetical protein [Deltaproteobacteria bacterium]
IPRHAPRQLAAAISVARRERGPVLLSLPLDVALARIPDIACPVLEVQPLRPNERFLDSVAAALSRARRPLILVGPEARPSAPAIRALASRLRIPVMTSPAAKGIVPEDRPGCLGVFGFGGHPSTRRWLEQERPDTLLVLGCSLSEVSTNSWSELLQPAETMIQLDSDSRRIGVNYRVDLAFAGDWHGAIEAIDRRLNDAAPKAIDPPRVTRLEAERETEDTAVLHPARLLVALQSLLPGDALFTADIGENLLFAVHHLRIREPDQFVTAIESGSMGSGLGAAVGAKAAAPNRTVVSICGDYAFQMYGMELATCVQEGWDVIFVVMNDARMRMVEAGLTRIYGRTLDMSGPTIDFAALARAHGAAGVVIETAQDLVEALSARPTDRPLLLDCRIDPAASFSANARVQELGTFNED